MRKHATALFLAASLALTACSGGGEPSASDSPPPTAQEIAYYDCLKGQGIKIVYTESGTPRVDKTQGLEKMPEAQKACEDKLPPASKPEPASPEALAAAQKEAACLRAEGVTWYPEPDPVTAQVGNLTPQQQADLRTKHIDAVAKCRGKGASDGVLGG
ncbi:hypothetical protein [Streptomyces sp. NPDC059979]|uniref:hypothetical protein n=1 Tax=Streptomyces sp. NPDC059979 TaxID=3347021 RepID=UPI0036C883CB